MNAERTTLEAYFYSLLAAAEPTQNGLGMPVFVGQPEFNQIDSGFYGWITDKSNDVIWRSPSDKYTFLNEPLQLPDSSHPILRKLPNTKPDTGLSRFYTVKTDTHIFFIYQYATIWDINDKDDEFLFTLAHASTQFNQELRQFKKTLTIWLSVLILIILLAQSVIFKWGLHPLENIAQQIKKLEKGEINNLRGKFPYEVTPIVNNLNQLLIHEQAQRKRYKNTLSDLAHSLKTPLASIKSQLSNHAHLDAEIEDQIRRMSDIIEHQLRRASNISSQTGVVKEATNLHNVVQRLINSLNKVYFEKNMTAINAVSESGVHFIDEHDAMELFGNIVENAYKYGNKSIRVSSYSNNETIEIKIEDDGKGVEDTQFESILKRGARADTATSGQGIGLAISIDITSSYDGSLRCEKSALGGAAFIIQLPLFTTTIEKS